VQSKCDVIASSAKALCAMTIGCPDNHNHIANHGGTAKIVRAAGLLASVPLERRTEQVQQLLDTAYVPLADLFCILSKCAHLVSLRALHSYTVGGA
jgi:hypothetical protein